MHTRVLLIASSTRVVHKFMYRRSACAYNNIYIYNIRLVMITGGYSGDIYARCTTQVQPLP